MEQQCQEETRQGQQRAHDYPSPTPLSPASAAASIPLLYRIPIYDDVSLLIEFHRADNEPLTAGRKKLKDGAEQRAAESAGSNFNFLRDSNHGEESKDDDDDDDDDDDEPNLCIDRNDDTQLSWRLRNFTGSITMKRVMEPGSPRSSAGFTPLSRSSLSPMMTTTDDDGIMDGRYIDIQPSRSIDNNASVDSSSAAEDVSEQQQQSAMSTHDDIHAEVMAEMEHGLPLTGRGTTSSSSSTGHVPSNTTSSAYHKKNLSTLWESGEDWMSHSGHSGYLSNSSGASSVDKSPPESPLHVSTAAPAQQQRIDGVDRGMYSETEKDLGLSLPALTSIEEGEEKKVSTPSLADGQFTYNSSTLNPIASDTLPNMKALSGMKDLPNINMNDCYAFEQGDLTEPIITPIKTEESVDEPPGAAAPAGIPPAIPEDEAIAVPHPCSEEIKATALRRATEEKERSERFNLEQKTSSGRRLQLLLQNREAFGDQDQGGISGGISRAASSLTGSFREDDLNLTDDEFFGNVNLSGDVRDEDSTINSNFSHAQANESEKECGSSNVPEDTSTLFGHDSRGSQPGRECGNGSSGVISFAYDLEANNEIGNKSDGSLIDTAMLGPRKRFVDFAMSAQAADKRMPGYIVSTTNTQADQVVRPSLHVRQLSLSKQIHSGYCSAPDHDDDDDGGSISSGISQVSQRSGGTSTKGKNKDWRKKKVKNMLTLKSFRKPNSNSPKSRRFSMPTYSHEPSRPVATSKMMSVPAFASNGSATDEAGTASSMTDGGRGLDRSEHSQRSSRRAVRRVSEVGTSLKHGVRSGVSSSVSGVGSTLKHGAGGVKHGVKAGARAITAGLRMLDSNKATSPSDDGSEKEKGSSNRLLRSKVSGKWGLLVNLSQIKGRIPTKVRAERSKRIKSIASDGYKPPTLLHRLCEGSFTTLEDMQRELANEPGSVVVKDAAGRLPLHVLGDNDKLMSEPIGRATIRNFAWQLMKAYPEGVTALDASGHMPFVSMIRDWEAWVYAKFTDEEGVGDTGASNIVGRMAGFVSDKMSSETVNVGNAGESTKMGANMSRRFPRVEMWEEVEFCFEVLSLALDELGGKNGGLYKVHKRSLDQSNSRDNDARNTLVTHVATSIPTLLKTLLLVEEEGGDLRRKTMKTSLIRRLLLCPESVGPWLISMLQASGLPSKRAIDYLILVSSVTAEDFVGGYRTILPEDMEAFEKAQEEVFCALDDLDGTVASLVVLDQRETERAASTAVLWHIMNKNLARPFVLSLVLIDLVLHVTLLLAFRSDVSVYLITEQANSTDLLVPTQVVYFITAHYMIRKVCEALAVMQISFSVFKGYITNMWTLFDMLAITMTLVAMSWNDTHPNQYRAGLNAFVIGLLWIKVLGFLKVVNKEMSTFILALIQILWDLRYFAIVMTIVIFMFADMMRIAVTNKDDGRYCYNLQLEEGGELEGPVADFCSPVFYNSYLRVYSLLVGDFELDNYKLTGGMSILFVIFTMIGVIILLNVLIAVVSDSYERAKIGSARLFGRARVLFVAQNQALESFLQPGANPVEAAKNVRSPLAALKTFGKTLRWTVLLSLFVTAMSAEVFLAAKSVESIQLRRAFLNVVVMIFMFVVLTSALWVFLVFAVGKVIKSLLPPCANTIFDCIDHYTITCVKWTAAGLFGLRKDMQTTSKLSDDLDSAEEEWTCRLTYMENQFGKMIDRATEELKDEITDFEKRLYEREDLQRRADADSPTNH